MNTTSTEVVGNIERRTMARIKLVSVVLKIWKYNLIGTRERGPGKYIHANTKSGEEGKNPQESVFFREVRSQQSETCLKESEMFTISFGRNFLCQRVTDKNT